MSVRAIPLFERTGHPTPFLLRQWTQKGGLQALRLVPYLDSDQTALPVLRLAWQAAFPTRPPLPREPLADRQGRGTDVFWAVFA